MRLWLFGEWAPQPTGVSPEKKSSTSKKMAQEKSPQDQACRFPDQAHKHSHHKDRPHHAHHHSARKHKSPDEVPKNKQASDHSPNGLGDSNSPGTKKLLSKIIVSIDQGFSLLGDKLDDLITILKKEQRRRSREQQRLIAILVAQQSSAPRQHRTRHKTSLYSSSDDDDESGSSADEGGDHGMHTKHPRSTRARKAHVTQRQHHQKQPERRQATNNCDAFSIQASDTDDDASTDSRSHSSMTRKPTREATRPTGAAAHHDQGGRDRDRQHEYQPNGWHGRRGH